MNSILVTTVNAKTSENHRLLINLSTPLRLDNHLISLASCSLFYNWKNFTKAYGNTDFYYVYKNVTYQGTIPDGSYSVADINNFIHHIMTNNKHVNSDGTFGINLYANPVYNRITITVSADFTFSMKAGLRETLGFTQINITNAEVNGDLVPKIEPVTNVLIHCNLVKNNINHKSTVLYAFKPNDSFGNLLEIKPYISEWTFCRNATFDHVEFWLTDQNGDPLQVEDDILIRVLVKDNLYVNI